MWELNDYSTLNSYLDECPGIAEYNEADSDPNESDNDFISTYNYHSNNFDGSDKRENIPRASTARKFERKSEMRNSSNNDRFDIRNSSSGNRSNFLFKKSFGKTTPFANDDDAIKKFEENTKKLYNYNFANSNAGDEFETNGYNLRNDKTSSSNNSNAKEKSANDSINIANFFEYESEIDYYPSDCDSVKIARSKKTKNFYVGRPINLNLFPKRTDASMNCNDDIPQKFNPFPKRTDAGKDYYADSESGFYINHNEEFSEFKSDSKDLEKFKLRIDGDKLTMSDSLYLETNECVRTSQSSIRRIPILAQFSREDDNGQKPRIRQRSKPREIVVESVIRRDKIAARHEGMERREGVMARHRCEDMERREVMARHGDETTTHREKMIARREEIMARRQTGQLRTDRPRGRNLSVEDDYKRSETNSFVSGNYCLFGPEMRPSFSNDSIDDRITVNGLHDDENSLRSKLPLENNYEKIRHENKLTFRNALSPSVTIKASDYIIKRPELKDDGSETTKTTFPNDKVDEFGRNPIYSVSDDSGLSLLSFQSADSTLASEFGASNLDSRLQQGDTTNIRLPRISPNARETAKRSVVDRLSSSEINSSVYNDGINSVVAYRNSDVTSDSVLYWDASSLRPANGGNAIDKGANYRSRAASDIVRFTENTRAFSDKPRKKSVCFESPRNCRARGQKSRPSCGRPTSNPDLGRHASETSKEGPLSAGSTARVSNRVRSLKSILKSRRDVGWASDKFAEPDLDDSDGCYSDGCYGDGCCSDGCSCCEDSSTCSCGCSDDDEAHLAFGWQQRGFMSDGAGTQAARSISRKKKKVPTATLR